MHRLHNGFTFAAEIPKDSYGTLEKLLPKMTPGNFGFVNCSSVLYASALVIPSQDYHGTRLPPMFILTTSYCGSLQNHLSQLVDRCQSGLHSLLRHCVGYSPPSPLCNEYLIKFLRLHNHSSAFGSRITCITKECVTKEKELRNEIDRYLNNLPRNYFSDLSSAEVKRRISRYISTMPKYDWAGRPFRKNLFEIFETNKGKIITGLLILAIIIEGFTNNTYYIFLTSFFGFLIILVTVLTTVKYMELVKTPTAARPEDCRVKEIAATQSHPVMNEMTAASPLKKGKVRKYFYYALLRVVPIFRMITVPTVTTIRWTVINDKKRLLFLSNYTNTTDFYVRDFLAGKTPMGVNLMFGNGVGFPDTRWLVLDGMKKEPEGFMNSVHAYQHVTQFSYAHEPMLTVDAIINNRKIRLGLHKNMGENEASEWLQLL